MKIEIMRTDFIVKPCPAGYKKIGRREFKPEHKWYAYITGENPSTGKVEQLRFKKDINRIKDLDERKFEMTNLLEVLREKLSAGWNPFSNKYTGNAPVIIITADALNYIIEVKRPVLRQRSVESYIHASKQLQDWMASTGIDYLPPKLFTSMHAMAFMDYLVQKKKMSGRSHNNILVFLRTMFNAMIERGIIQKNPFAGIKKLQFELGKNVAFSDAESLAIDTVLKAYNIRLYYFKEFVYSAAIRRTELTLLRVRDIKKDSILISSSVSKNKKQESVAINQRLKSIITMMQLDCCNQDDFIFGAGLKTGPEQFRFPNHISTAHSRVLRKLNIRKECTLYSWKHTGAIKLYEATRDPYLVMRHLRHHSLEMTMIYLKSLGINSDERLKELNW